MSEDVSIIVIGRMQSLMQNLVNEMNTEEYRIQKTQWTARLNELRRMEEYIKERIADAYNKLADLELLRDRNV